MISYREYLFFYNQVAEKQTALLCLDGCDIYVRFVLEKNIWEMSTQLARGKKGEFSNGVFRWQKKGAYLSIDPKTSCIHLRQEVTCLQRYLLFKYLIRDFMNMVLEWKEILVCKR